MSKFTLTIDTDNAAFGESAQRRDVEIVRILGEVKMRLSMGADAAPLHDINGNTVGEFRIYTDD